MEFSLNPNRKQTHNHIKYKTKAKYLAPKRKKTYTHALEDEDSSSHIIICTPDETSCEKKQNLQPLRGTRLAWYAINI